MIDLASVISVDFNIKRKVFSISLLGSEVKYMHNRLE